MKHNFIKSNFPLLKCVSWNDVGMGAVGSIGSAAVNQIFNRWNMSTQHEYNMEMQKDAQEFAVNMWNMNNAYNDPKAVRERMKNAGLNPLLMNENGGQPASSTSPSMGPGVGLPGTTGIGNPVLEAAQLANIEADTENKRNNAALTAEQKDQLNMINDVYRKTKDARSKAELSELLNKLYQNNEFNKVFSEYPEVVKHAYRDTWQLISQNYFNTYLEGSLMDKDLHIKDQDLENLKKSGAKIEAETSSIISGIAQKWEELSISKSKIANERYLGELSAAVTKYCKGVDAFIAQQSNATGIKVAQLNQDWTKAFVDIFRPILKAIQTDLNEFVDIGTSKGLEQAFKQIVFSDKAIERFLNTLNPVARPGTILRPLFEQGTKFVRDNM